jgi:hypothetical protein
MEVISSMQRFRSTWLALMGGALLITLSVSAAFGAAPSGTADGTRGQTIAGFVNGLIFGNEAEETDEELVEEDTDEENVAEENFEDPVPLEEVNEEEELDEEPVPLEEVNEEEELDEENDVEEFANHGACVSAVARDKSAVGGKNNNHGGAVSEAARFTCRGLEVPGSENGDDEEELEEVVDEEELENGAEEEEEAAAEVAAFTASGQDKAPKANAGNGNGNGKPQAAAKGGQGKGNAGGKANGTGAGNGKGKGGRP